ncbi:MAG: hypothetical protein JWP51_4538 [Bradyrhizobium sp.]|jgi:hypothetical protein|nr:hypothetical protein [Bradyrhizobium sp.]
MQNHSNESDHVKRKLGWPVVVAMAVAIFGVPAMLIVDHSQWSRPKVQTAEVAVHKTTGEAARATVTPTAPKPGLEPDTPWPKPVQPANPATP